MSLVLSAALRYDDTREGQLGDILHFPGVVDINIFGSKTDPLLAGQVAVMPAEPGPPAGADPLAPSRESGLQALVASVHCSLRRLSALPPSTIGAVGRRLAATSPRPPAGPEAMGTWPRSVQELARPLYAQGLPVHMLPYYGPWMWEPIDDGFDLSRSCTTGQFVRWSRSALLAAGRLPPRFGAHSMRRGRAAELAHGGLAGSDLSRVLRHSSPSSSAPYVLQSVHVTRTAAAMRAAELRAARAAHPRGGLHQAQARAYQASRTAPGGVPAGH